MNRREFLSSALALGVVGTLGGSRGSCVPAPNKPIDELAQLTIVDAHNHIFNAMDIPVQGFVLDSVFSDAEFPLDVLVAALEFNLRRGAPDFFEDNVFLDDLLAGIATPKRNSIGQSADAAYAEFLAEVEITHPHWLDLIVTSGNRTKQLTSDDIFSRAFLWMHILTHSRHAIVQLLKETYPDVALFTPAMLDMELWLRGDVTTSIPEQIALYEKVVRIEQGRVHPFVGFDPLRQVNSASFGGESALDWVQDAVMNRGFVGVKLYPPMGFRASANTLIRSRSRFHRAIEYALEDLYTWAEANDVPIMAHSSKSFGSQPGFEERANPIYWGNVLVRHPNLRVNFSHFGGDTDLIENGRDSWAWIAASLMAEFEHVYADAAFHDIGLEISEPDLEAYFREIRNMFIAIPQTPDRLMYGSDWQVNIISPGFRQYLVRTSERYAEAFPNELPAFLGENALRFLGLDGADSGNRRRLLEFYARNNIPLPAWWR